MPIRMSGLQSGLDTDSIIKELMQAQSVKRDKIAGKQTKLEWKEEKWKELNTKIYKLYTDQASKMRLQSSYKSYKASSSNESKVMVSASGNAPIGSHTVQVNSLAQSQYITGSKVTSLDGSKVTSKTKLTNLGFTNQTGQETIVTLKMGETEKTFDMNDDTTVSDFVKFFQQSGLNASFDEAQQKFYVSSKESGVKNAFEITTSTSPDIQYKNNIKDLLGYTSASTTTKTKIDNALNVITARNTTATPDDKQDAKDVLDALAEEQVTKTLKEQLTNDIKGDPTIVDPNDYTKADGSPDEAGYKKAITKAVEDRWDAYKLANESDYTDAKDRLAVQITEYEDPSNVTEGSTGADGLELLGLSQITFKSDGTIEAGSNVNVISATDCNITYNGAEITSASNTITANGITFTAKGTTAAGETIALSVEKDAQATYDMVKGFVTSYNEILKEMNELYNAKTAKGYEPLTDEQKEAMTDDQIEKWETKIKDSLLRRDDSLGSLLDSMKTSLSGSVEVNGKKYSLANFGISSSLYTEKGILHISGDKDDATLSGETNKLMKALEDDPDTVVQVISSVASQLYSTMADKMKSSTLSSALTFYNDKEMKKTQDTYAEQLKKLEVKLTEMENRYYKQFSGMEAAMSKLNSQTSALSGLLGGSSK